MPPDPSAVQLAQYALYGSVFAGVCSLITAVLSVWNQQRLFRNQRQQAKEERAWDIEDRQARHVKTIAAVADGTKVAERAYKEANHVNEKIEDLHKEIGAVLDVAKAVKNATGEHKPLGKADIVAVAEGVVQAIGELEPLVKSDIPTVAKEVAQAIRATTGPLAGD